MKIFKISEPHLADVVINAMQDAIAENLPFMDNVFGRAERIEQEINGRRYTTPNVYRGGNDYTQLLPCEMLGNYCYFSLNEPSEITREVGTLSIIKVPFSVVFWLDIRKITQVDNRDTEKLKELILSALHTAQPKNGTFQFTEIYERAENVFKGYTLDNVNNNFLVSPFCGYRFDGVLTIKNNCYYA